MKRKRLLSWLLTFAMFVGMLVAPASAEGSTTTTTISGDGTADKTGTMTITLTIPKKNPAATDLTYTAPSDLVYSGSDKTATVAAASDVMGIGNITVKYYSDAARTTEVTETKNVGTYYVGATVAGGDNYNASTAVLYGDGWTFEITKSTPSAPSAPTAASTAAKSITLTTVDGCEYSKDGTNWQNGTEFTGLLPNTAYTFYQRVKATANTNASAASSTTISTLADTYAMTITLVISGVKPQTLTYSGEPQELVKDETAADITPTYALGSNAENAPASGYGETIPTGTNAGSYYVWFKENDGAAKCVTVTVAPKPVTVSGIKAKDKTYNGTTAATLDYSEVSIEGKLAADTLTVTATGTFADANVGEEKTVTINGITLGGAAKDNYTLAAEGQQATDTASITAYNISNAKVYSIPTQYLSNGSATPDPAIRLNGGTLKKDVDYTLSYANNTAVGTGTVTITGKEPNFSGTTSKTFTIEKQAYPYAAEVTLSAASGAYGTIPTLGVTKSDSVSGESIRYYYSSAPSGDAKTEFDPSKPLNVGTWYIWAEITTKDYALAQTARKVFTVSKAEQSAPDASVLPTQTNGYNVAVALPAGKTNAAYEYAITASNADSVSDSAWSTLPKLTDGKFTATGLNLGTTYKVWLRLKADGNHTASPSISTTLTTPADVMLSYDTNGGSGTVTAPKTYTSGATTNEIDSASGISRYGYTFDKWTTAKDGSGTEYAKGAAGFAISANTTLYAQWTANSYTVAFNANGGTAGSMSNENFTYGTAQALTSNGFTRTNYTFAGWAKTATGEVTYKDKQSVSNLAASGTVTLYAVWVLNTYSINGTVKEEIDGTTDKEVVGNVGIKLERGGTQFGATVKTGADGTYTLSGVPAGTYNIVAERTLEDGTKQTTTILVTVTSGDATANEIILPAAKVNSKLTVTGTDTPAVMVGELNEVAKDNAVENSEVTVTMTVEKKDESAAEGADEIKELAATASSDNAEVEYLDIGMKKETKTGGVTSEQAITQTSQVLELIIPFNLVGRNSFSILRHHAGVAAALRERYSPFASANAFEDGWFFVDRTNSRIYIYADQFSTYGIGYAPVVQSTITFDANGGTVTPATATTDAESGKLASLPTPTRSGGYSFDGWFTAASGGTQVTTATEFNADTTIYAHWSYTGSGSGSGSGSSTSSRVTVVATKNGTVSHSPKNPSQGSKVTITAKPNVGYQVDVVTVKDASGKNLVVTDNGDGTFTYTQPSGKVTVEVTFKETSNSSADVLSSFTDVDATAWYVDAIRWAVENGVMNGVGNNKFNPNGDTSRAMVVTMLWRMERSPAYVGMSEFSDVENTDWYGQAVRWANAEGIVEGYRDANGKGQMFNPNGAVTREQLAAILYRYAQYKKADVSVGEDTNILSYDDAFSVSGWATSAMQWTVGSGIINGIGSNLVPAGNASRAQVATMLMRYSTNK